MNRQRDASPPTSVSKSPVDETRESATIARNKNVIAVAIIVKVDGARATRAHCHHEPVANDRTHHQRRHSCKLCRRAKREIDTPLLQITKPRRIELMQRAPHIRSSHSAYGAHQRQTRDGRRVVVCHDGKYSLGASCIEDASGDCGVEVRESTARRVGDGSRAVGCDQAAPPGRGHEQGIVENDA